MRVLVLHFLEKNNKKHAEILKNLEQSARAKGHDVTLCNEKDAINLHMAMFEYIAVVTVAPSVISAKLPEKLSEILSAHGSLSGKKGCALVVKYGLFSNKMCRITMKAMEKEGMVIDYFEIIENPAHAAYVGKKLG
ncbi:MAG: hypothetical protein R3Y36_08680 [Spirochaetales bacterium]